MVKKNIAIIGAGQIGSRHLQACNLLVQRCNIFLVDPSESSLQMAEERFVESVTPTSPRHHLSKLKSIQQLPQELDIVIVATASTHRACIISELVSLKKVNALILEKVLFQTLSDYESIGCLIKKHEIPTWVNCWMRAIRFYQDLKDKLSTDSIIKMTVEGPLWGLGCNSIHYLDLFAFLTDDLNINFDIVQLDSTMLNAKRDGFKEFTGMLGCSNSKGDALDLICKNEGDEKISIRIEEKNTWHEIVGDNQITYLFFDGKNLEKSKITIPYQSQITNILINQITLYGNCMLTRLDDSINIHIPFIKVLLNHLDKSSFSEVKTCPIT
jgi:hypothetical protein